MTAMIPPPFRTWSTEVIKSAPYPIEYSEISDYTNISDYTEISEYTEI